jgi:hypothetical protein
VVSDADEGGEVVSTAAVVSVDGLAVPSDEQAARSSTPHAMRARRRVTAGSP